MNIFGKSILISLALSIAFPAYTQAPAKKLNIIERQYRTIKDDVRKVQKCYFSKSKCNQEERKEAQKALGRLSAKTLALIGTIIGISASVYVGRQMWPKRKEKEEKEEGQFWEELHRERMKSQEAEWEKESRKQEALKEKQENLINKLGSGESMSSQEKRDLLSVLIMKQDIALLNKLFNKENVPLNQKNNKKLTPLQEAIKVRNAKIVEALLDAGASATIGDPLDMAIFTDNDQIIDLLIQKGANPREQLLDRPWFRGYDAKKKAVYDKFEKHRKEKQEEEATTLTYQHWMTKALEQKSGEIISDPTPPYLSREIWGPIFEKKERAEELDSIKNEYTKYIKNNIPELIKQYFKNNADTDSNRGSFEKMVKEKLNKHMRSFISGDKQLNQIHDENQNAILSEITEDIAKRLNAYKNEYSSSKLPDIKKKYNEFFDKKISQWVSDYKKSDKTRGSFEKNIKDTLRSDVRSPYFYNKLALEIHDKNESAIMKEIAQKIEEHLSKP